MRPAIIESSYVFRNNVFDFKISIQQYTLVHIYSSLFSRCRPPRLFLQKLERRKKNFFSLKINGNRTLCIHGGVWTMRFRRNTGYQIMNCIVQRKCTTSRIATRFDRVVSSGQHALVVVVRKNVSKQSSRYICHWTFKKPNLIGYNNFVFQFFFKTRNASLWWKSICCFLMSFF